MLTSKREKVIEKSIEKGGVTQEMLEDIYSYRTDISRTVQKMVDQGFLEEEKAPECDSAHKVYFPTQKGKVIIDQ